MGKAIKHTNGQDNGFDFDAAFQEAAGNGTAVTTKKQVGKNKAAVSDGGFDFDAAFDAALKKKDEPISGKVSSTGTGGTSPLASQSSSVSEVETKTDFPSPVNISPEERQTQIDYLNQPMDRNQISIADNLFNPQVSKAKLSSEAKERQQATEIEKLLNEPTVSNVKKLAEQGIQKQVSDISTRIALDKAKAKGLGEKVTDVDFDKQSLTKELTDQFNKKFIAGELDENDIDVLKAGNPLIKRGESYLNNSQVAYQINQKTKNLKSFARAKDIDGNTYYFTAKSIDQNLALLNQQIKNAESSGDNKILVGQTMVSREDYVSQLNQKKQDLIDQQWFLKNDFKNNRYDPIAEKQTKILIDKIEKSGEVDLTKFGTGISQDEDIYIKKTVDDYLKKLNNPVINAEAGNVEVPLNGREYLSIYNEVRNYFHNIVPVKGWVENDMKNFMQTEQNKKFQPLIDNFKKVNDFFSTDENQKFDSVLYATTDANQAAIISKYNKQLSKSPKYIEISNKYWEAINKKEMLPEEANSAFDKEIRAIPEFKPILSQQDKEIQGTIINATKQREKRLIQGIAGLPENIIMYADGTIGIKGKTKEETKTFIDDYSKQQRKSTEEAGKTVASDRQMDADKLMVGHKKYTTGLTIGYGNMMESASRWLSNSFGVATNMRDYYSTGDKAINEITNNSQWAANHFKYNGLRSLIDPAYYAYSVGQSASYMIPGIAASFATGGGATGAITGGVISSAIETGQNKLQIYNDLLTTGTDEHGLAITPYAAAKAAADDAEFLPNMVLASLEFGALFRAAKSVKPTLNIAGGIAGVGKAAVPEAVQEGIQGYFQYNATQKALGKPEADIWDYMQTDDFRQNLYGGLTGGIGFGGGTKAAQLAGHSSNVSNWKKMVESGNEELAQNSLYGYAQQAEKNGQGSIFRDALKLRLQNEQFKDDNEKKGLLQMLAYSAKLSKAVTQLNVAPENIAGMATAHNLSLSELYENMAKDNEGTPIGKVYDAKSKEHLKQAESLVNGKTNDLYYVNTSKGNTVFLSKQNADVLEQEGILDNLMNNGTIESVSDNIKLKEKPKKDAKETKPETQTQEANVLTSKEGAVQQAAAPSVIKAEDIHVAAKESGIDYESNEFMDKSEELTGERHLDKMNPAQLQKVKDFVSEKKSARLFNEKLPLDIKYADVTIKDLVTGKDETMSASKAKKQIEKQHNMLEKLVNCLTK